MYIFTIKASDAFGHSKTLEIEAQTSAQALTLLKTEGFYAQLSDIISARKNSIFDKLKAFDWESLFLRVSKKDLHRLIKLIGHSLVRGKTLKHTLEFITENEDSKAVKKLVDRLILQMEKPFTSQVEIFGAFPKYFDEEFLGIIEAGETSSNLGEYLVDYSQEKKKQEAARQHFSNLLMKRLVTFFMVLGVAVVVVVFVIPQFQGLFGDKLEMPWAMNWLMQVSDFLKAYGLYFLLFLAVLVATFVYLIKQYAKVRWWWDDLLLHLPLVGRTLRTHYTTQFAYLLSTLLTKNVDIVKALNIIIKQTKNVCMLHTYQGIVQAMQSGDDLFSAIVRVSESGKPYLIPSIVQAAKVGSETASLGATLMDVRLDLSELFSMRLERAIKTFSIGFYSLILIMAVFIAYAIGSGIITFYNNAQNLI